MTREDFEQWVEDHKDEAIEQIEATDLSLKDWIKLFGKSLKRMHEEEDDVADDDDEYDY